MSLQVATSHIHNPICNVLLKITLCYLADPSDPTIPPAASYTTPSPTVALSGNTVTLHCLFSGKSVFMGYIERVEELIVVWLNNWHMRAEIAKLSHH